MKPSAPARRLSALLPLVALLALPAAADMHLEDARAAALFLKSTFAHGYMHGYELGYRVADTDVHMGRAARKEVERARAVRKAHSGYERGFGRRAEFIRGYRQGLRVGYADSYHGHPFRALAAARALAAGLQPQEGAPPSRTFDAGFIRGYGEGISSGLSAVRVGAPFEPQLQECGSAPRSRNAAHSEEYCDGLRRGYALGYSDGYAEQRLPPDPTAIAGVSRD
jgi:hypothetical protein